MSATPSPADDLLARAADALWRTPVPEGPSHEAVLRLLAALPTAAAPAGPEPAPRAVRRIVRAATAAVAAAVLLYAAGWWVSQPAVAVADVARKLRVAHTLAYRMTVSHPRLKEPVTTRLLFKEPGLMRSEGPEGQASVTDLGTAKTLLLQPKTKTALLVVGQKRGVPGEPLGDSAAQVLERLRRLAGKDGRPLGTKRIGPAQALGFQVEEQGQEYTVWADPKTKLPLLIEMAVRVGDQDARVALSDFELDPELDDTLFSLEPQADYALRRMDTKAVNPEDAVVQLLRAYAETSGGTFPQRLDDWAAYDRVFRDKKLEPSDPECVRLVQALVRVMLLSRELKGGYGYQANGVKRGDAARIVFWYRPEGSAAYRVVYGDLRVGDVTADRLPGQPLQ
jgi:outer membrane lipoprotein-sorting protein